MPEENETLQCECCDGDTADMEVHTTDQFAVVCEECYENKFYCCDSCSNTIYEQTDPGNEGVHGECVCRDCTNENTRCVSCENVVIPRFHEYYEHPHDYEQCCSNCAEDYEMFCCDSCGTEVYYSEAGQEHAEETMCYDCYNRTQCHIDRSVQSHINKSKVLLSPHYQRADETVRNFFRSFYGYTASDYDHNSIMLPKSGGGYGKGFGYYNSYINVTSSSIRKMKEYVYSLLQNQMMVCDHRKLGLYNPLHDIFSDCFRYYDEKRGEYVAADSVDAAEVGRNWSRYSVSSIDSQKIFEKMRDDMQNGGALRQKIIKTLSGSARNRLNALYDEHNSFWDYFEQYKTNTAVIKLPIKIGFDPADLDAIRNHNAKVNSCQVESNNESYSFSMIDIVANPHLMCLIYDTDGKTIIGRSVVRLFKEKDAEDSKTYVCPSRLYLSNYTHAKQEIYDEMFCAVDAWGKKNFENKSQLIAGTLSHHDTPPADMLSTTKFNKKSYTDNGDTRLVTQWWHSWFQSKPDNSEARFVYYQDEDMITNFARVNNYDDYHQEYVLREQLRYRQYSQIEVKNENEQ